MKFLLNVQEEFVDGESSLFITLPDEILEELKLSEGDMIEWVDRDDGSFQIKKSNA